MFAFEDWLGRSLVEDEVARAEATLNAVSALIRAETARSWLDDDGYLVDVPDEVVAVTLDVTRQVFNNPDNRTSESIGDWSASSPMEFVGLRLRPDQKAILSRYRLGRAGLWTLSTTRGDAIADTEYVPVVDAPPFPWWVAE